MSGEIQVPTESGQSDRAFIDEALSGLDAEAPPTETKEEEVKDPEQVEVEDKPDEVEIDIEGLDEPDDTKVDEVSEETEPEEKAEADAPLPEYKDIKAKYPDFFNDFPALKEAFFLGKQLTSLFPSYELAQEAKDQLRSFEAIRISSLEDGDPTHLFSALSEANPAGFERLVENILPNLFQHAPQLYLKTTTPILENMIRSAFKEGKENENKNLMAAAQIFSKYLFGTTDIPQPRPKVVDPEVKRLAEERRGDLSRREQEFKDEVYELGATNFKRLISTGLDPNNTLPDLTKEALINKIMAETGKALDRDGLHNNRMNALWELAARHGFAREYRKKLVETYLRAANSKMPAIRAKLRGEVLAKSPAAGPKKEVIRRPPGSKVAANNSGKVPLGKLDPKKIDWSKTSDRDILAGRVTLKTK